MSYIPVGTTAVDFSQGGCGPGMYKPYPNGRCEALPGGFRAPEWGTRSSASPDNLPGGNASGWGTGVTDFSGGSCGAGMVRPSPTSPCVRIERGMGIGMYSVGSVFDSPAESAEQALEQPVAPQMSATLGNAFNVLIEKLKAQNNTAASKGLEIPNWVLAGGAVAAYFMFFKKKRRR